MVVVGPFRTLRGTFVQTLLEVFSYAFYESRAREANVSVRLSHCA